LHGKTKEKTARRRKYADVQHHAGRHRLERKTHYSTQETEKAKIDIIIIDAVSAA
jgi:hypothetical protein